MKTAAATAGAEVTVGADAHAMTGRVQESLAFWSKTSAG